MAIIRERFKAVLVHMRHLFVARLHHIHRWLPICQVLVEYCPANLINPPHHVTYMHVFAVAPRPELPHTPYPR